MKPDRPKLTQDRMTQKLTSRLMQDPSVMRLVLEYKARLMLIELSAEYEYEIEHRANIIKQAVNSLLDSIGAGRDDEETK